MEQDCVMELGKSMLQMQGKALNWTDKRGSNLSRNTQVMKSDQTPEIIELTVVCRLMRRNAD